MNLKEQLERARTQLTSKAGGAMQGLGKIGAELGMKEASRRLQEVHDHLFSENFRLIVFGRFKNGKSTIVNALLGKRTRDVPELPPGKGPMPVDDLPCTATLSSIRYSDKPYVKMWRSDGSSETWTLKRYLDEATVKTDDAETQKFFENIREFEVGFPAELCQSGVTFLDSPGLDDVPLRTAITREAVTQCDAAIALYRHEPLAGQGEREFVARVVAGTGTRVFTIVNLWNGRVIDERLKATVWNRLVKEMSGEPAYSGQDLASRDIYFVDGRKAEEGKLKGDHRLVQESGLAAFEQRLGEFLVKDRQRTHVERWVRAANDAAAVVEQQIGQRRAGLQQDQQRLLKAYQEIQPQLAAIRARREKLPLLFERYRRECQRELKVSFQEMVNQLRQDLPDALKRRPLPSLKTWSGTVIGPFQQRKLCEEALVICNEIVSQRIAEWSGNTPDQPGAQQVLAPILSRLIDDIRDEVAQIERAYAAVQFQLTGWNPKTHAPLDPVGMPERVLAGLAGILVGDFASLFGAGGGGWRAVGGNLAGQLAAGITLAVLGLSGSVVFLPAVLAAGIAGSLLGGNWGLDERIKRTAILVVDQGKDSRGRPLVDKHGKPLRGLASAGQEAAVSIDDAVAKLFQSLELDVMRKVGGEIDGEEQNIQRILDDNKRDHAEKVRLLAALDEDAKNVAAHRQVLKQVGVEARVTL